MTEPLLDTAGSGYYTINSSYADDNLTNAILSLQKTERQVDSRCKTVSKIALMGLVSALSLGAKVPFIPISLDLGTKWGGEGALGKSLGALSAYGNSTAFFILEFWAGKAILNDLLNSKQLPKDHESEDRMACALRHGKQIVIIPTSFALALVSQLPSALAGVQYNTKDFKYVAGAVLLVTGSILPTRSLQLSFNNLGMISCKSFCKEIQSTMQQKQKELLDLIKANHQLYIQMPRKDKLDLIRQVNEISQIQPEDSEGGRQIQLEENRLEVGQYLSALLPEDDQAMATSHFYRDKAIKYLALGTGSVLTCLFHYALGEYTHEKSKEFIWDNEAAAIGFASLAVGANFYLFSGSIIGTTQRVFNTVGNLLWGTYNPSIADQVNPGLSYSLKLVGLVTDVLALGPTTLIWPEFYHDNEVKKYLFTTSIGISLFLILFTSTLDIIDDVVEGATRNDARAIVDLHRAYQKLTNLIENSSVNDFIAFHAKLPEEFKNKFLTRIQETGETLKEFAEAQDV